MINLQVGLGIIGLGYWSSETAHAVRQVPDLAITHCFSLFLDTVRAFAGKFDCKACPSYDEMLESPQFDGVVVMSANVKHEQDVMRAASKGKNIFVSKPIATTMSAAKKMIKVSWRKSASLPSGYARANSRR